MPPLGRREFHPRLGINTQPLGDPVDVIEVADDLNAEGDLFVGETMLDEPIEVRFLHRAGVKRQLGGKIAKRAVFPAQGRAAIIVDQLVGRFILSRLRTEVLRVRKRSVEAIVEIADDSGEHFFTRLAERILRFH